MTKRTLLVALAAVLFLAMATFAGMGYAEDSGPPPKAPAAEKKTHALPADATATVIIIDYLGGMLKPQNDDPLMVIRADGSVTLETWGRGNLGTLPMFSETRNTKFGKPVGPGPVEI